MKKLPVVATVLLIGAGSMAATQADAHWRGGGLAAGVIGGLAAGALIGAASNAYGYGHGPYYGYAPGYAYAPAYSYGPAYGYARPYRSARRAHARYRRAYVRSYYEPAYYAPAYGWGGPGISVSFGGGPAWGYGRPYWGW